MLIVWQPGKSWPELWRIYCHEQHWKGNFKLMKTTLSKLRGRCTCTIHVSTIHLNHVHNQQYMYVHVSTVHLNVYLCTDITVCHNRMKSHNRMKRNLEQKTCRKIMQQFATPKSCPPFKTSIHVGLVWVVLN